MISHEEAKLIQDWNYHERVFTTSLIQVIKDAEKINPRLAASFETALEKYEDLFDDVTYSITVSGE